MAGGRSLVRATLACSAPSGSVRGRSMRRSGYVTAAGGATALAAMSPEQLQPVLVAAATESFRAVSVIPVVLVIAFGLLFVLNRVRANAKPQ